MRHAVLNRPRVLNALSEGMIDALARKYGEWDATPSVGAVVLSGAGRGFCAGGDVKDLAMGDDHDASARFFKREYRHDCSVSSLRAAHVALLDGVTMGGGCGVALHGAYRVATENTKLAMPECAIGLFPDVGASWVLPRLAHSVGWYLALTGASINGADALACGAATHFMRSADCERVVSAVDVPALAGMPEGVAAVGRALDSLSTPPADVGVEGSLDLAGIERCFGAGMTVEGTLEALAREDAPWAVVADERIRKGSPLSLRVTQAVLEAGARASSLADCLSMEYRVVTRLCAEPDFKEGVRALLVDKDNRPTWANASLDEVPLQSVKRYFEPMATPEEELFGDAPPPYAAAAKL